MQRELSLKFHRNNVYGQLHARIFILCKKMITTNEKACLTPRSCGSMGGGGWQSFDSEGVDIYGNKYSHLEFCK